MRQTASDASEISDMEDASIRSPNGACPTRNRVFSEKMPLMLLDLGYHLVYRFGLQTGEP